MSGAVRVGDTVHRAAGPWTPTVHRLLRHLRGSGVPEPLGVQDDREVVSFLPGTVPQNPMPAWVWTDGVLVDAGRRLAALHAVTVHFAPDGGVWQLPVHEPVEVVCHNDFAPYNLVFDDDRVLTGVIDWDTASPGPRVWDLAYLAYRLVPLSGPGNPDLPHPSRSERDRRLALLCDAYGDLDPAGVTAAAVARLHELADFTAARAAAGAAHVAPHVQQYRNDAAWLADHRQPTAGG